jgi:tetratricopeptide (TPR) repeat protein
MATLQVFVSHTKDDTDFCHMVVEGLIGAGADVWYDEHNMGSGMLLDTIEQEIRMRPVFVVILSPAALRSQWVRDECKWAYMRFKRDSTRIIQPVLAGALPDEDEIPMYLQDFKRIEAPGLQPYSAAEATRHLLHALALTPAGQAPAPIAPQPRESGDDLLERGKALIAQKRYADALLLIERATQLLPDSFDAWFNRGVVLDHLERWTDALPALDRALALDPADAFAWHNKGAAFRGQGRYSEALEAHEQALALDPTSAGAWIGKGAALDGLGRYSEALAAYDRALALGPNFAAFAWNNKGASLHVLGRYEEALVAYDRALALDPADARFWDGKGNALNKSGRYAEALSVYERSLTLDAQSPRGWKGKAQALRGLGSVAEAEAAERRAKELGG